MEALGLTMAISNWERVISIYCSIVALFYVVKGELWNAAELTAFGVFFLK